MLCRDLWCFLGSVRAYGEEAPCGEGEGFAISLLAELKTKQTCSYVFIQIIPAMREPTPQRLAPICSPRVTEVFSGSQKLVLIALTAGVMWDGLTCLPFTRAQEPHGKQVTSRWIFMLSSHTWGYMGNVLWGAPCFRIYFVFGSHDIAKGLSSIASLWAATREGAVSVSLCSSFKH